jgi:hypothetical protein
MVQPQRDHVLTVREHILTRSRAQDQIQDKGLAHISEATALTNTETSRDITTNPHAWLLDMTWTVDTAAAEVTPIQEAALQTAAGRTIIIAIIMAQSLILSNVTTEGEIGITADSNTRHMDGRVRALSIIHTDIAGIREPGSLTAIHGILANIRKMCGIRRLLEHGAPVSSIW